MYTDLFDTPIVEATLTVQGMHIYTLIFITSLSFLTTVSGTPLQETLVGAFKIISQLFQQVESSPMANFFSLIQERFLQKEYKPKGEEGEGANTGLWNNLFQNFGLQAKHTPAVALNFLIFLAQMVGNAFPSKPIQRNTKKGKSIFEMVVEQPKVSRLLSTMQSPKLIDVVLSEVGVQLSYSSSDCVLQLLCRTSPVVKGMQASLQFFSDPTPRNNYSMPARGEESFEEKSKRNEQNEKVSDWNRMTPINRLFYFMPSTPDFMSQGEFCKNKYPNC